MKGRLMIASFVCHIQFFTYLAFSIVSSFNSMSAESANNRPASSIYFIYVKNVPANCGRKLYI